MDVDDDGSYGSRITPHLQQALSFIREALYSDKRNKVLVHCWRGKSRSVTILIAYLIRYHGMEPDEALSMIRETRPTARPNSEFRQELYDYYYNKVILPSRSNGNYDMARMKMHHHRNRNHGS